MGKKISSDTEQKILQLFNFEQKTITEIAKILRVSRPTIYSVLKTNRVPVFEEKKKEKKYKIY